MKNLSHMFWIGIPTDFTIIFIHYIWNAKGLSDLYDGDFFNCQSTSMNIKSIIQVTHIKSSQITTPTQEYGRLIFTSII